MHLLAISFFCSSNFQAGDMYADAGMLLPFMQGFPLEESAAEQHPLPCFPFTAYEDYLFSINLPSSSPNLVNFVQTSAISEYDLGGEGDLFNAPKPILEESLLALDPTADAMPFMSGNESINIMEDTMYIDDMELMQNEDLLCEVFYDCNNDLLAQSTTYVPSPEASDIVVPAVQTEEVTDGEKIKLFAEGPNLQKSVSFGCLSSVDCTNFSSVGPCLLDVHEEINLESAFRKLRTFSEGDIQSIGIHSFVHGNMNIVPYFEPLSTTEDVKIEERNQKLSRYRKKRATRNFGRKIKYACRKALADSQPRIRGRFAKMENKHSKD